jgi:hypothetical protein
MVAFFSVNKVTSGEVAIFFRLFSHTSVFFVLAFNPCHVRQATKATNVSVQQNTSGRN